MEPTPSSRAPRAAAPSERPPASPRLSHLHTFQCHDALWTEVEEAARTEGCRVDELIGQALSQFLGARPARPRIPPLPPTARAVLQPPVVRPPAASRSPFPLPSVQAPGLSPPPPRVQPIAPFLTPPRPVAAPHVTTSPSLAYDVPPGPPTPVRPVVMPPPVPTTARPPTPPPFSRAAPPPLPRPSPPRARQLIVHHGGQAHVVAGPLYAIGRRRQSSGFSIKNPNVSGTHVTIEESNGAYYLVDQRSTNGTRVNGVPIVRHLIQEGDVAELAEEFLHFSFGPPAP